jgi:phosphoribosylamine--glycine ligase
LKLLIVGGGGREHALVWKLSRSTRVSRIYTAPGNAGTASLGENLPIKAGDINALADAAQKLSIDLTVVGPEAPLAAGIVDRFQGLGLPVFGPTAAAAQIEASKALSHHLMQKYGLPCPPGEVFSDYSQAQRYVKDQPLPLVVKADGLAAGKGVTVAHTRTEALSALHQAMSERVFGAAGEQVLIDQCLSGREVSLLAFTDGTTVMPLVPACDYKRIYDGDRGPNTGGMGGFSPPGFFTPEMAQQAVEAILEPAVRAMAAEGCPYRGVLYAGLMLTEEGIKVLEFNCRFGDPETQVTLPRMKSDLLEPLLACVNGGLDKVKVEWDTQPCVGVVMASSGYPGDYRTGYHITGMDGTGPEALVFHAGTRIQEGQVVTDGGRVLAVAALGDSMEAARNRAYENVSQIHFEGCYYRRDIAATEVK